MSTIKGAMIGVQVNGVFISCETSCDFNFDADMLPASSVNSGRWKEFIAGIRSWDVSVNGNFLLQAVGADAKTLLAAFLTGAIMDISFRTRIGASTSFILTGKAFVQGGGISAPSTGKTAWNVKFQGSGPFTF